jgi:hypothetical protein
MLALLCALFFVKHYLADWQFQTLWMVRGKRRDSLSFVWPLSAHAGMHGVLTLLLALCWLGYHSKPLLFAVYAAYGDFATHFIIDRAKALIEKMVATGKKWKVLLMVLDQMAHFVVTLIIIAFIYEIVQA